jgi:predicted nuclease with TOPRIM domain
MIEAPKIAELATLLVIGIVGAVVGIQKLLKGWKETSTESSIISLMHKELERMAAHNKILSQELASLQIEIVNLNRELRNLSDENQKLHKEVASLTAEVTRLQTMLQERNV